MCRKPDCDYQKVSAFFESISDLSTGAKLRPLRLDREFWREQYDRKTSKFNVSGTVCCLLYGLLVCLSANLMLV